MCKVGDIILIKNYIVNGVHLTKHSFVVLNDKAGQIQGLDYDIICNTMSSFKNDEQRKKKLSYPSNFEILHNDQVINNGGNDIDGFIKAEQFYYFDKDKIDYMVIGTMKVEAFNLLLKFIDELNIPIQDVVDNLK